MPAPLELPESIHKNEQGRWVRNCPLCNAVITHLRRNYCIGAHNIKQPCKRCSNISNHPSGMHKNVRISWYESFRKSTLTRGYSWEVTLDDINDLYEEQNKVCELSGISIGWSESGWEHTASIDRVDNNKGYTVDNIQLVHKQVNMMRGSLTVPDFLKFCQAVADKVKW
jgi:hypothetical protein